MDKQHVYSFPDIVDSAICEHCGGALLYGALYGNQWRHVNSGEARCPITYATPLEHTISSEMRKRMADVDRGREDY